MENRILTKYQPLHGSDYAENESPESIYVDKANNDIGDQSWNHINDLDVFFKNVYLYYQDGGFYCKLVSKIGEVIQVIWITSLTILLCRCINFAVLFGDKPPPGADTIPTKLSFANLLLPWNEAKVNFNMWNGIFIASSVIFTTFKLGQTIGTIPLYLKIKKFYEHGLKINENELDNYTWNDVTKRIINLQKEQPFCIQKEELNELDIHHRILRFTNYFIAMVNQNVIDLNLDVPFIGKTTYLSRGLRYNLDLALFWGPFTPFASNWRLSDDFKRPDKLNENANKLRKTFRLLAIINLIISIFVLIWQVLYFFYSSAQFLKNEYLKFYRWSMYGQVYLRHFNELDHELNLRLSKAFNPSLAYVKTFSTKLSIILASHFSSLLGAPFIILICLTVWSTEVLQLEHVFTTITVLGCLISSMFLIIPNEAHVDDPERHLAYVLHYIKYSPEHWMNKAHTPRVKKEFSKLFEHKVAYILEDFISPFITPYMLWFKLPNNAVEIADFFRKFTIEIDGVGDVCSFSHLKAFNRHDQMQTNDRRATMLIDSKTMGSFHRSETSLLSFYFNNRNWTPPEDSASFIADIQERWHKEKEARSVLISSVDRFFPPASNLQSSQCDKEDKEFLASAPLFDSLRNYQRDQNYYRDEGHSRIRNHSDSSQV